MLKQLSSCRPIASLQSVPKWCSQVPADPSADICCFVTGIAHTLRFSRHPTSSTKRKCCEDSEVKRERDCGRASVSRNSEAFIELRGGRTFLLKKNYLQNLDIERRAPVNQTGNKKNKTHAAGEQRWQHHVTRLKTASRSQCVRGHCRSGSK